MNSRLKIVLIALFITVVIPSCKYYDEGPVFSLRSRLARISNDWAATSVTEDGTDQTSNYKTLYANYLLSLKKDKTYRLSYRLFNVTDYYEIGTWDCSSDDKKITLLKTGGTNNTNNGVANTWEIVKLMENDFWVKQKETTGQMLELHLKPN